MGAAATRVSKEARKKNLLKNCMFAKERSLRCECESGVRKDESAGPMRYPYQMLSYLYPTVFSHTRPVWPARHRIFVQCSHTRRDTYRYVVAVSLLQGNLQCIQYSRFAHSSFADFYRPDKMSHFPCRGRRTAHGDGRSCALFDRTSGS